MTACQKLMDFAVQVFLVYVFCAKVS